MTKLSRFAFALLLVALTSFPTLADVHVGDVAPSFMKNELVSTPFPQAGPARSLSDYAGRVLVIHLLGYS